MAKQYPDIYVPTSIQKIGNIIDFIKTLEFPAKPIEPKPFFLIWTGSLCLGAIFLGLFFKSLVLFLILLGVIIGLCFRSFNKYKQRLSNYNEKLSNYNEKYQLAKEKFDKWPKRIKAALQNTSLPHGKSTNTKKGFSEKAFFAFLEDDSCFKGKISKDLYLKNPSFDDGYHYTCDIAYIYDFVHIDIEIDEPYDYLSREPIHFLGYKNEEVRNKFFQENGWFVIRFSEEQIINHPYECATEILLLIDTYTHSDEYRYHVHDRKELTTVNRWTFEQAKQMAVENYRQVYLNEPHYAIRDFLTKAM